MSVAHTLGFAPVVCPFSPVIVTFNIEAAPSYAMATLQQTSKTLVISPQDSFQFVDVDLRVRLTDAAPAFDSGVYSVTARAAAADPTLCNLSPSGPATADMSILVEYMPAVSITTDAWQGNHPQPIVLENQGNGMTLVTFEWMLSDGRWVDQNMTVYLESPLAGSAAHTSETIAFDSHDVPQEWDGRLRITGKSAFTGCRTCHQDIQVITP